MLGGVWESNIVVRAGIGWWHQVLQSMEATLKRLLDTVIDEVCI
jgi:hypothetical protein